MPEKHLVISHNDIKRRVQVLGREIAQAYQGRNLVVIGILNGSFVFLADLIRQIDLELKVDFLRVASYGNAESPSELRFVKDIELPVAGRDVLVVEDIIDTGKTINYIKKYLSGKQPNSIKICTLIDKRERREVEITADYTGFEVKQGFLVGYGLDYAEQYRNLPDIYHLKPQPEDAKDKG